MNIINAEYIEVSAEVRYWEDTAISGEEDLDGRLVPFREDDIWKPIIRLEDGKVMDWPEGMTASVHYKVADCGQYFLLDSERRRIAKYRYNYVPDRFLCHGDTGYGDYIIFNVGADGIIEDYRKPVMNEETNQYWDFSLFVESLQEQLKAAHKKANQPDFIELRKSSEALISKLT